MRKVGRSQWTWFAPREVLYARATVERSRGGFLKRLWVQRRDTTYELPGMMRRRVINAPASAITVHRLHRRDLPGSVSGFDYISRYRNRTQAHIGSKYACAL